MSAGVEIDVRIDGEGWESLGIDCGAASRAAIQSAAQQVGVLQGTVDLLLTTDAEMRRLNAQWRGIDKPTDVLSFPAGAPPTGADAEFLGDIALGLETCVQDAKAMERDIARHVSHLAVHGFLHLLGYDHVESADAEVMEALEVKILGDLGYPNPYDLPLTAEKPTPVR